jgi:hypothetical protein
MGNWFSNLISELERGFFCPGQEIKGLRGDVHKDTAQVSPQIEAARTGKDRFRTESI